LHFFETFCKMTKFYCSYSQPTMIDYYLRLLVREFKCSSLNAESSLIVYSNNEE
jgi:hypothetical protein